MKTNRKKQRNGGLTQVDIAESESPIGIVDLFCGTGGFSHGFASLSPRFRLLGAIDVEADPAATTQANHSSRRVIQNDIRLVKPSHMKSLIQGQKVDVIIGGPPCQGFSSLRPFRSLDAFAESCELNRP